MTAKKTKLDKLIVDFRRAVKSHRLHEPLRARGLCETISGHFAYALHAAGYEPMIARIDWTYLDEDEIALSHFAVLLDGKVYDWTATQFFGPSSKNPSIWETEPGMGMDAVESWAADIDQTMKKYGEPEVDIVNFDPTLCTR